MRPIGAFLIIASLAAFSLSPASMAEERTPKSLQFEPAERSGPVYVIPLDGMIDNMLSRYLDRALSDAEDNDASVVIFQIDTFGGLVDAADKMRQRILNATVPTVAFIDQNAASAGALISYATDRIVMVPGASIGAATVVQGGTGESAPDKYQSYMRSQMRATAEARDRDPRIAEAMVDENLEVEGVSPAGQVLTLSAREAYELGVADAVLGSIDELRSELGVADLQLVEHRSTPAERVLRAFGSPVVQSVLILMMLGGLYFEFQTPGLGVAGMAATMGAVLFFAPHYLLGLVHGWEIVIFFIGVLLILVELFIIPGFGVPGIMGLLMVVGSLFASLVPNVGFSFPSGDAISTAIATLAITLVLLLILGFSLGRYLPHSERLNQLVLSPELTSATGYTSADTEDELVGKTGTALTTLRPSGTATIDGERVDVVATGSFVPEGSALEVVSVRGSRVEVRQIPVDQLDSKTPTA